MPGVRLVFLAMNRAKTMLWTCLLFVLSMSYSCKERSREGLAPAKNREKTAAGWVEIKLQEPFDHYLFTFLLADGTFQSTEKMEDIPQEARSQIIVIDTRLPPEKRGSSEVLYVADVTQKREDGTYPCRPVSRFKFERELLREPSKNKGVLPPECQALTASPSDRVVIYSTSWCSVCDAAKEFMKKEGIPFEDKDVEKDPAAQKELTCKAYKSTTKPNGVPVLDINGTLLLGFDRDDLLRLWKQWKNVDLKNNPRSPAPAGQAT